MAVGLYEIQNRCVFYFTVVLLRLNDLGKVFDFCASLDKCTQRVSMHHETARQVSVQLLSIDVLNMLLVYF
jgi:hypothetical protein